MVADFYCSSVPNLLWFRNGFLLYAGAFALYNTLKSIAPSGLGYSSEKSLAFFLLRAAIFPKNKLTLSPLTALNL